MKKIIIIGDAGRGKSQLAARMSQKLDIPAYSTDDYFYEVKFSKPRDKQLSIRQIGEVYVGDKWIVEGTTKHLLDAGLESANLIIYLKYRNIFSQWLVLLKRHLKRKEEKFSELLGLMVHVFKKRYGLGYKKGKMTHAQVVEPYRDKLVVLRSFGEIDRFFESLDSRD